MALVHHQLTFERLPADLLTSWSEIPTAIASDVLNRARSMAADIVPLQPGLRLLGQARTLSAMVADSSGIHVLGHLAGPGDVLVLDVGGYVDCACWGGNATRVAIRKGVAGLVLNGAVRDAAEIRQLGFAVFCRGTVPRGPHKGHGGDIDVPVAVGGVSVAPGDLVLGDDDGVVVVPLAEVRTALKAARDLMLREEAWVAEIEQGRTTAEIFGLKLDRVV